MIDNNVLVIGGGAAGMTAAIFAARSGAKVKVLEQLTKVGRKILATGNGRCNLTNINTSVDKYYGRNTKFAYGPLSKFGYKDTMKFFEDLGLSYINEDGRIYPASQQASSVLDVLRYEMELLGIEEICDGEARSIRSSKKGFEVKLKDKKVLLADKIILATGGKANPGLGSTGTGYDLAKQLGHKIIEPYPALVQLRLEGDCFKGISGVRHIGKASLYNEGKIIKEETGEIQFTNYGASGIPVIQLSRHVGRLLKSGCNLCLNIDLFPLIKEEELLQLLMQRCSLRGEKPLNFSFVGLINKRLIKPVLDEAGISHISMPCKDVTKVQLQEITNTMKSWSFKVLGTKSWSEAITTTGGIDVTDIDPRTMESKLQSGLYFAGEILDIDGDCGGYNLQWAWTTGFLAGINAGAKRINSDTAY